MKGTSISHQFVEFIPDRLAEGTLYVSIEYAIAVHLCACGCGNKVVTPISPAEWQLMYDGDSVSLTPSIGNWAFPCRSHYWIRRNEVQWARAWSSREIEEGRLRDAKDLESYFNRTSGRAIDVATPSERPQESVFRRVWRWVRVR